LLFLFSVRSFCYPFMKKEEDESMKICLGVYLCKSSRNSFLFTPCQQQSQLVRFHLSTHHKRKLLIDLIHNRLLRLRTSSSGGQEETTKSICSNQQRFFKINLCQALSIPAMREGHLGTLRQKVHTRLFKTFPGD
jgi:hypothetical protein